MFVILNIGLHVILSICFTVIVNNFNSIIYENSNDDCINFGRCSILKINNLSSSSSSSSSPHENPSYDHKIYLKHICPVRECYGDTFCCEICQNQNENSLLKNINSLLSIELTDVLMVPNQIIIMATLISMVIIILSSIDFIAYVQNKIDIKNAKTRIPKINKKKKRRIKLQDNEKHIDDGDNDANDDNPLINSNNTNNNNNEGKYYFSIILIILTCMSTGLLFIVILESIIIFISDFHFYKNCYAELTNFYLWFITAILISLQFIFIEIPRILRRVKCHKRLKNLLRYDPSLCVVKISLDGDNIISRSFTKILSFIGGVSLLCIISMFVYIFVIKKYIL